MRFCNKTLPNPKSNTRRIRVYTYMNTWRENSLGLILLSLFSIRTSRQRRCFGNMRASTIQCQSNQDLFISCFRVLVLCWSPLSLLMHKKDTYGETFLHVLLQKYVPSCFATNISFDAMVKERVVSMAVHHDWGFVAILLEIAQGHPVNKTLPQLLMKHVISWN